jgi:hypothetical protein
MFFKITHYEANQLDAPPPIAQKYLATVLKKNITYQTARQVHSKLYFKLQQIHFPNTKYTNINALPM